MPPFPGSPRACTSTLLFESCVFLIPHHHWTCFLMSWNNPGSGVENVCAQASPTACSGAASPANEVLFPTSPCYAGLPSLRSVIPASVWWYTTGALICVFPMAEVEHFCMCSRAHRHIFLGEVTVQAICPFFKFLPFSYWVQESFSWYKSFVTYMNWDNFLPVWVCSVSFFNCIFNEQKAFFFY